MKRLLLLSICAATLCGLSACNGDESSVYVYADTAKTHGSGEVEDPDNPGPDEPVTPGPDEPVTPGPDEPVTPGPDEPVTPGPDEPVTPGPDEPVDPPPSCTNTCEDDDICEGDSAFKTCKDSNGDGCNEWVVIPCAGTDKCDQGKCAPTCADTCSGGPECDGTSGFKTCKDGDGDGCNEWVQTKCNADQKCEGGKCVDKCTNACESGKKKCEGNAVQTCGDYDNDGCFEWGANTNCGTNQTCSDGKCADKCTSSCEKGKKQCSGKSVQTCDDHNGDGCYEWGGDSACSYQCKDGACINDLSDWVPACSGSGCPIVVTNLKERISGNTKDGVSKFSSYSCSPGTSEAGPEQSYVFKVDEPGTIIAGVTEPSGGDVDVHILSSFDSGKCLDRGDKGANAHVNAGIYYVVVDTYNGSGNAGSYNLKITFLPDSGKCGLDQTNITHVKSKETIKLPKTGKVVQEAHLVTDHDREIHGKNWWPSSFTDGIAEHKAWSEKWTGINYGNDWCPNGEGGCEYGQGSVANQVPWKAEAWYVCMYWTSGTRPKAGTRFLVVNPQTGQAVVTAAGYETGPGDTDMLGGAVYEIHKKLGTGHKSTLTFGQMKDQSLEYGPIDCE